MAFTMHAHSGQFCPGHAADQLEDIVRHAISIGYKTMGLTEHMPRYEEQDLYPEEVSGIEIMEQQHVLSSISYVEAQIITTLPPTTHIFYSIFSHFTEPIARRQRPKSRPRNPSSTP